MSAVKVKGNFLNFLNKLSFREKSKNKKVMSIAKKIKGLCNDAIEWEQIDKIKKENQDRVLRNAISVGRYL